MAYRLLRFYIHIFLLLFFPAAAFTQSFSYVQYDTRDGLAGSTVYDMCQDKEGFIWFATENGLSRFDGTNFKNYSVKDGLPDNEVLKLYADSKGRVWMGTFSKEPSYFYKGKIYNRSNDSNLARILFLSNIYSIDEDLDGNIIIGDNKILVEITNQNEVKYLTDMPVFANMKNAYWSFYPNYFDKGFFYIGNHAVYKPDHDSLEVFYRKADKAYHNVLQSDLLPNGEQKIILLPNSLLSSTNLPKSYKAIFANTTNGAWSIDTVHNQIDKHFLPGKKVSSSLIDREQNTWFTTFGEGVYKMPSKDIRIIHENALQAGNENEVYAVLPFKDDIIAGIGDSKAMVIRNHSLFKTLDFSDHLRYAFNSKSNNRLYSMEKLPSGTILFGFDNFLVKSENGKYTFNYLQPVKSITAFDTAHILVATRDFSYKIRISDLAITDTIWRERCTDIFYQGNRIYIGTLQGLYEIIPGKSQRYLGDLHHALQRRINDIKTTEDGTILVATNDEGLVAYKDGQVLYVLNDANGLSSNICKTIFVKDNNLWAGTNKGINKIDLSLPAHPVTCFSVSDGLPSDIIHALYIDDSCIWAATPAGLVFFNEKKISERSMCNLELLAVTVSDAHRPIAASYDLSYRDNNIRFDFAGISFKSGKEIKYYYILNGLDKDWNQTRDHSINYQSLPPGNYEFQLYAKNKYAVQSHTIVIRFTIATPFWKAWWFFLGIIFLIIGLTAFFVNQRNKKNKARLEEKRMFQKQFASLEQQALQAQMNPHFIFNCMSSIQQYILLNDRLKANQYLTDFASLIRQTMENSGRKTISLEEEVSFLEKYLQMEKMRFGDRLNYRLQVDENIHPAGIEIPAMILQPFVENAIRHGIRPKKDDQGMVEIAFSKTGNILCCRVTDNGVGRAVASGLKSEEHIEYQSRGMSLTSKRIELFNKMNDEKIELEVIDRKNDAQQSLGTEVIIKIPV